MYCPRCGQQQISDEVRFCSRCGLPLGRVAEVLDGVDDVAPRETGEAQPSASRRREKMRKGLLLLAGGIVFTLIFLALSNTGGMQEGISKLAMIITMAVSLVGLIQFLIAFLSSADTPRKSPDASNISRTPLRVNTGARQTALPPLREDATMLGWQRPANTSEMAQPSSVTENTTKLLEDEARTSRE